MSDLKYYPTVLPFGTGRVLIAMSNNSAALGFKTVDEPNPIGDVDPEFANTLTKGKEFDVIMDFDNVESLDCVIVALKRLRDKKFGENHGN